MRPFVERFRMLVRARGGFVFDDEVAIESGVAEWGRTSFIVRHRILKGEIVAVEGHEKRIWAAMHEEKPGRIKPLPVPAEIVAALSAKG